MVIAAYVHLPFCRRRCFYCDFAVFPLGDRLSGEKSGTVDRYLDYLEREIAIAPQFHTSLSTVFIGGGTPSLLSPQQIERVLGSLDKRLRIAKNAEISIEIDPGTFDEEKLRGYIDLGINRFSMGVQAFQDELLTLCGRSHTVSDIWDAIAIINRVGIDNWSLDLISGLPTQTLDLWQHSLEKALEISPTHISTYDLIVEPKTVFARYYQPGETPLPDDDSSAAMYRLAVEILSNGGYEHYEISNYARSGYKCKHNLTYWHNHPYYGFGMGAASYLNQRRFTRPRQTQAYYQWVENLIEEGGIIDCPAILPNESLLDKVMLGLRLAEGIDFREICSEFGQQSVDILEKVLTPYISRGWVSVKRVKESLDRGNNRKAELPSLEPILESFRWRLTDPEGFLFSNTILTEIFSQLE